MKNKYLKGAHISERKVRELLKLFCEDLTATQIANISGISRITVNAYLKLIRTNIAKHSEEHSPIHTLNGHHSSFPSSNGNGQPISSSIEGRKTLYGIIKHSDAIYTDQIALIDKNWLNDWLKGKIEADPAFIQKSRLNFYHGIADFSSLKLHRINSTNSSAARGRSQIDEVDLFWGLLKSRLAKFRGLNGSTLYLHVKETEFRYNNRNQDLYDLVISIINRRPLHLSRM